ncbi:MAG: putative O-glycosylation ligase, exosortase A system-associated [Sphingomonadales bacterium]|nr:putative O-glycosylation ligase, exosortase A system-associated [Sphingomonadaceae bacterium]MBS3930361.1 putative O-glycosylation ligase, exosortase A system-associated [Sphingomonadales bacterium]
MLDLAITLFTLAFLALGFRKPFLWVLAFLYIDTLSPQKISYSLLASMSISLVAFVLAFMGWLLLDDKRDSRFTMRQGIIAVLLVYSGLTTMFADFPVEAAEKWSWVWKALVFAIFLPLTLRTRLRIEAAALVLVLSVGTIIINGGIKTVGGGGGYGTLRLLLDTNFGLYEGSIISAVSIAVIPLIVWLMKHGTIFKPDWRVKLFGIALIFACALIPIGTQARTGLLCLGFLGVLSLRTVKRRFLYLGVMAALVAVAIPFLPESFAKRMDTIENHKADQSASTRVAVWMWTLDYVKDHPLGGGFDAYRSNKLKVELVTVTGEGNNTSKDVVEVEEKSRAYHSSYFEMLGEQGWPGLFLWLWLLVSGLWQMEKIRSRWKNRTGPGETWQAPLANALQQSLLVYMLGGAFVGIAFQPFCYMLIGLQCGLWSYLKRIDSQVVQRRFEKPALRVGNAVAAP